MKILTSTWQKVVAALVVVIIVLIIAVPLVVKSELQSALTDEFKEDATVGDLIIRPFQGVVEVYDLSIGETLQLARFSVEIELVPLLYRQVNILSIDIEGLNAPFKKELNVFNIGGLVIDLEQEAASETPEEESAPWRVNIHEIRAQDSSLYFSLDGAEHTLGIQTLEIHDFASDFSMPIQLALEVLLDESEIDVDGTYELDGATQLIAGTATIQNLDLSRFNGYHGNEVLGNAALDQAFNIQIGDDITVETEGSLTGDGLQWQFEQLSQLSWDGTVSVLVAEGVEVGLDGTLAGAGYQGEYAAAGEVSQTGKVELVLAEDTLVKTAGALRLAEVTAKDYGSLDTLAWDGDVSVAVVDTSLIVETDGSLGIGSIQYQSLASLGKASWQGQMTFENRQHAEENSLNMRGDMHLDAFDSPDVISIEAVEVVDLELKSLADVQIQKLLIQSPKGALKRDADGQLRLPEIAQQGVEDSALEEAASETAPSTEASSIDASSTKAADTPADLPTLLIADLQVLDGEFMLTDASVKPTVNLGLSDIDVKAENFSLTNEFPFTLNARHGKGSQLPAELNITGTTTLLPTMTGDIAVDLAHFELHEIGPYLDDGIQSGRLNLNNKTNINGGQFKATNHVTIEKIKVNEQSEEGGDSEMSLSMALFLLKDGDGNVELDVPIETNLEDYSVGISQVVSKAMITAAQKGALTYAKYALQPYGGLLLLKDLAGVAMRPRFEPIKFPAGVSAIEGDAEKYVEKITGLMLDRPNLAATACGFSSLQDVMLEEDSTETPETSEISQAPPAELPSITDRKLAAADPEALRELARLRGLAVREALVAGGVAPERLFECQPRFQKTEAEPRVELSL